MSFAGRVGWAVGLASLGHGFFVVSYIFHVDSLLNVDRAPSTTVVVVATYVVASVLLGIGVRALIQTPTARLIADLRAFGRGELDLRDVFGPRKNENGLSSELRAAMAEVFRTLHREAAVRDAATAGIAHDLKTPLIAARRWLRSGLDSPNEDRLREGVAAVVDELQRVVDQVQRLIDVQRFGRADVYVGRGHVALGPLIDDVIASLGSVAEERVVRMARIGTSDTVGDAQALRRAIENLVSNAIRHARSNVTVEVLPGLVRVIDDGTGFPECFDSSTGALGRSGSRWNPSGAGGLGWFVAGAIARAHGGRLVVERSNSAGAVVLLYLGTPPDRGEGAP